MPERSAQREFRSALARCLSDARSANLKRVSAMPERRAQRESVARQRDPEARRELNGAQTGACSVQRQRVARRGDAFRERVQVVNGRGVGE
jgi:hypothetical protein